MAFIMHINERKKKDKAENEHHHDTGRCNSGKDSLQINEFVHESQEKE